MELQDRYFPLSSDEYLHFTYASFIQDGETNSTMMSQKVCSRSIEPSMFSFPLQGNHFQFCKYTSIYIFILKSSPWLILWVYCVK